MGQLNFWRACSLFFSCWKSPVPVGSALKPICAGHGHMHGSPYIFCYGLLGVCWEGLEVEADISPLTLKARLRLLAPEPASVWVLYSCHVELPGERGGICRCFYGREQGRTLGHLFQLSEEGPHPCRSYALFVRLCFRISSSRGLYPRQRIWISSQFTTEQGWEGAGEGGVFFSHDWEEILDEENTRQLQKWKADLLYFSITGSLARYHDISQGKEKKRELINVFILQMFGPYKYALYTK